MRCWWPFWLAVCFSIPSFAQNNVCTVLTNCIGVGAPSSAVQQAFIDAWQRNGFNLKVGNPSGGVSKYGSTGLIQQFPSAVTGGGTLALIKPDTNSTENVYQVQAAMFAYYSTVSVATAGYPTGDTANCPGANAATIPGCQWQTFTTDYALFVYAQPINGSQNFAIRDPYYTKWTASGGITGLGTPISAETAVTSQYSSQATVQTCAQGAIYNITSGVLSGRLLTVSGPVYGVYTANNADAGSLGLPATPVLVLSNGMLQQTFEGGVIQYDPATGMAVLQPPVGRVTLTPQGPVQMKLGDTLAVQATVYSKSGSVLTDRTVTWTSSNGQVAQIQANGLAATIKATGAGTATVTAGTGGTSSQPLSITVTAPCCQIGEGAPTAAIQQAFQAAATRNGLNVKLPAASAVERTGNGYVQPLASSDATAVPYLVTVADGSTSGYVVAGGLLTQYLALGGPARMLGYPLSDATAGGRQSFQQATLAGSPVQVVAGAILAKWATLGYETGAAGSPISAAGAFLTFQGTAGSLQNFQRGMILSPTTGTLSGNAFFVSGPILAMYNSNSGPGGDLGAPIDDQHLVSGLNQQDFEGGSINYASGSSSANLIRNPRQPLVTAMPATVLSGTQVHLVAGGFSNGAMVRVSQTGQPDFIVTVTGGAYAWDSWVPAAAASGVITISAADMNSAALARGAYTIRNASSATVAISIVSGDQQTGAPGAQLSQPLVVAVKDQTGNPVPGQTVTFTASSGAQIVPVSATTGGDGQTSATLRLPASAGVALVTAQAGHQLVTFSAKSAALSLANFPTLTQAVDGSLGNGSANIRDKGALLAASASILRYYQMLNVLPQPNGLADPATLNGFLKSFCISDHQGNQICDGFVSLGTAMDQTVNLWRLGAFAANDVDVVIVPANLNPIRDLVSAGSPVLLALSLNLSSSGSLTALGSHFVVATGVASDGSLVVSDPDPAFGETNLSSYLNGFTIAAGMVQGTVSGAVQLVPRAPNPPGFLVASTAPVMLVSAAGLCGPALQFPDTAAVAGIVPSPPGTLFFRRCDGSNGPYELDIAGQGPYNGTFTDLSVGGGRTVLAGSSAGSSEIVRSGSQWAVAPLAVSFSSAAVVNAANPFAGLAPGGLVSIYGAGFSTADSGVSVQVNGAAAPVVAAFPFQVNAQIPLAIAAGPAMVTVSSANGAAQQPVTINTVAPAIFSISSSQAAITNVDNSLNTPSNPALRGGALVIYGTGFGAVSPSGGFIVTNAPVNAVIGGVELHAAFAGLTPGSIGLYQVNVLLPLTLPPGLSLPIYLEQAGATSNTVTASIE